MYKYVISLGELRYLSKVKYRESIALLYILGKVTPILRFCVCRGLRKMKNSQCENTKFDPQ